MGMPEPMLFPLADTVERYLAIRGDESRLRSAVTALCDHLGLRAVNVVRLADSSLPVYAVDARVLKLHPKAFQRSYEVELRVPQALEGGLPIPTPGWSGLASSTAGAICSWSACAVSR
jgi:hypothetical protein